MRFLKLLLSSNNPPQPLKESALLFGAAYLAPIGLRLLQMIELDAAFCVADIRGMISGMVVSGVVALALIALQHLRFKQIGRIAGLLVLWFWVGLQCGNFEHVRALGTMINLAYAGYMVDATFFKGSVMHMSHPVTFALALLGSTAMYWWGTRSSHSWRALVPAAALAIVAMVTLLCWETDPDKAVWRQRHCLSENLRWAGASEPITPSSEEIPGLYPGELDGEPIIKLDHPGTNVLLVVLEGISGAYLESVARAQGIKLPKPRLPALDKRAKKHLSYINFINHQRQTNRGLYSLVCGDLPKQITLVPKMSELGFGTGELNCLPAILRREGYETVYVQSAPLGFMGKDKFMPRAGFASVNGVEFFKWGRNRSKWGVDDQSFFAQVQPLIDRLRSADKPFLLTLLTAGTHHPFMVPGNFVSDNESGSFAYAVDYLDQALLPFLEYLEQSGVLDDTLVMITSDESYGIDGTDDSDSLVMAQAFGSLTVMVPGGVQRRIDEPFMQFDVPLSVVDYLGYRERRGGLGGRSVFQKYSKPRVLPFANTYMRMSAAITPKGELFACAEDFSNCRRYQLRPDRLFAPARERKEATPDNVRFIKQIAARSLYSPDRSRQAQWQLIETGKEIPVKEYAPGKRIGIFASQFLSAPAGSRIDVEIDFEVLGEQGEAKVRHGLYGVPADKMPTALDYARVRESSEERADVGLKGESALGMRPRLKYQTERLHRVTKTMRPEDRFRIKYSYGVGEDLEYLNCALYVWIKEGPAPRLLFHKASLAIGKLGADEETGKRIELFEIEKGGAAPADNPK